MVPRLFVPRNVRGFSFEGGFMEFKKRNPKIFILSGKARSGKDFVANLTKEYYQDKKCICISYAYYLKDYAKRIIGWDGKEETKPREFLQQLGIELIKHQIDEQLLIRRVIEDIEVFSYFYDVIIITDARMKEEIEIPKEKFQNVITIRVVRDNYSSNLSLKQKQHFTETALDTYVNYDYVFDNSKTEEESKKAFEKLLKEIG